MTFRDLFSESAAQYTRFRPDYPAELIAFAASLAPQRDLAWDCATGNGQAAAALAEHFDRVIATDASAAQLEHARRRANIEYRVARAEDSGLPSEYTDLVTVAQALHWFDREAFYAEANRVLRPNGALVTWGYGDPTIGDPEADAILQRFNFQAMGQYWPVERGTLRDAYTSKPFPFETIDTPTFVLEREWTRAELVGYISSWSAVSRYRAMHSEDPIPVVDAEFAREWNSSARYLIRWPLLIRAGRRSKSHS